MMPILVRSMRPLAPSAFSAIKRIEVEVLAGDGGLILHRRGDAARLERVDDDGGHAHGHHLAGEAALALADAAAAVMDHHRRHGAGLCRPVDLGRHLDRLALLAALERNGLALLRLRRKPQASKVQASREGRQSHSGRNDLLLRGAGLVASSGS